MTYIYFLPFLAVIFALRIKSLRTSIREGKLEKTRKEYFILLLTLLVSVFAMLVLWYSGKPGGIFH